jgi:hypothetical protein
MANAPATVATVAKPAMVTPTRLMEFIGLTSSGRLMEFPVVVGKPSPITLVNITDRDGTNVERRWRLGGRSVEYSPGETQGEDWAGLMVADRA